MNQTIGRVLKLIAPYGLVVVYRYIRLRANSTKCRRYERNDFKKKYTELLNWVEPILKCENPKLIVSLTTYGERARSTTPLAVSSILRQTIRPDRVVVWLAYGEKCPRELRLLKRYGVDIERCEDIRSYKKLVPALKKYPRSVIVTADDDILYPEWWLEKLTAAHKINPTYIIAHRARKILVKEGVVQNYWNWPLVSKRTTNHSSFMVPTGAGGVLYPPGVFDGEVNNEELFMKLAPHADDLWFWALAELSGARREVLAELVDMPPYELDQTGGLSKEFNDTDGNNKQMNAILNYFSHLAKKIDVSVTD